MVTKSLLRKGLAVEIILCFIGVAIVTDINASIDKKYIDEHYKTNYSSTSNRFLIVF